MGDSCDSVGSYHCILAFNVTALQWLAGVLDRRLAIPGDRF